MTNAGELLLTSGRRVSLRELRQYSTYEGWMEGYPTAEHNKAQLERLVREHSGKPYDGPSYLIPPVEEPVELREGEHHPFGTPMLLPRITSIGRLESPYPTRWQSSDYSGLVVIWFQKEFALPIDPVVSGQMLLIDWERHAIDLDF